MLWFAFDFESVVILEMSTLCLYYLVTFWINKAGWLTFTDWHLSAQAKHPPVGAQGGGVGRYLPPLKTIFPVEFMHKKTQIAPMIEVIKICKSTKKKRIKCFTISKWRPFENVRFTSLDNTLNFEGPLSRKSFLTKYGSH